MGFVGAADDEDVEVGIYVGVGVVSHPAVTAFIIFQKFFEFGCQLPAEVPLVSAGVVIKKAV